MKRRQLRRKILGRYDTLGEFAKEMGVSPAHLSTVLSGDNDPTFGAVRMMCEKLGAARGEIGDLFFPEVKE